MKAGELFVKTMPFVWAKLILGLATVLISVILFAILVVGIGYLFNSGVVAFIMFIIWLSLTGVVRFVIMHWFGYLIKAGHVAVMVEAVTTGKIPDRQIAYAKEVVKERFVTANIYFVIDKLVKGAVKQIQRVVGKVGKTMSFVPGMKQITSLAQFFVDLSLGYVDECCLGYTFYKKKQSAFKSAADGVVIYWQNWKVLLKDAAKTMAMVIFGLIGITLVLFLILGLLFRAIGWSGLIAFILSILLAVALKSAFMDSFILARTMATYMGVAPKTAITVDLYGKLCNLSAKFKELFNKGQEKDSTSQPAKRQVKEAAPAEKTKEASKKKQAFCGECGAKNEGKTKFCPNCGAAM